MNAQDYKQALPPGFRLGSYRVVRVLGVGGFGVTYLCEHGGLGVTVAVKEYLPNDIAVRSGNAVAPKSAADREGYQWGLSRFLDEARTLARFEHRNVVRVRDYFEANGAAYIVMDYEDGEPLDRVLERKGTLTEAQIKRVLLPIVAGLRQVHAAGFLHRDVKPANIFIRRSDESPVLLDFGSARQALSSRSRSVTAIASAGYSPPEQYESDGEQGPWTDIYALSALCYRAITGMAPVEATRRQSRLLRDEEDPLPRLAEVAGGRCSRAFLEAVDRGLRVVEGERQGSLDEWRAELEGGAGETANASTAVRPAPREGRGLTTPAEIEGGRSRRPLGVIALLLVGLLVQAVALWELLDFVLGRSLRRSRSSGEVDADVMSGLLALPVAAAVALALLGRRPKREVIALLLVGLVVQVVALWELVTVLGRARGVVYGLLVLPGAAAVSVVLLGWQRAAGRLRWRAWGQRLLRRRMKYGSALTDWLRRRRMRKSHKAAERGDATAQRRYRAAWLLCGMAVAVAVFLYFATVQGNRVAVASPEPAPAPGMGLEQEEAEGHTTATEIVSRRLSTTERPIALRKAGPMVGDRFRDCPECPEMMVLPAGSYRMGSPWYERGRQEDEGPAHEVTIAVPFAIGVYEVTVAEFGRFVEETGYSRSSCITYDGGADRGWRNPGLRESRRHPVACVSWNDAQAYATWLSRQTGEEYRLPSESEWEYVARAGTRTARPWGEGESGQCRHANGADASAKESYSLVRVAASCRDGHVRTAWVGSFGANGWGLHDMLGNVWEWTEDCWNDSYAGAPSDGSAWEFGNCARRVLRGGSWFSSPSVLRAAGRYRVSSGVRFDVNGFRVARTLAP